MANQNPQRPGQTPAPQPPHAPAQPPVTAREDDVADERDDDEVTRPGAPREEDSLLAAARRKLGLREDASALDLLRAVAGMAAPAYSGPARAACKLRLSVGGRRVVLSPGDLLPEGVDASALPPHAVEGR